MKAKKTLKTSEAAKRIRKRALSAVTKAKSSHVGSALSCADILATLYFEVMKTNPEDPKDRRRDRFILSKGHACSALYSALVEKGLMPESKMEGFCQDQGSLFGHSVRSVEDGVEASTGSLGHGLSIGVGMALAGKRDGKKHRVFVLMGDGECDEGSVWEAAMLASHLRLDNLVGIVDYNKLQNFGRVGEVVGLEPFASKWRAFGWDTVELDGHDHDALSSALSSAPITEGKPTMVIAHTVKGKGVSFMEDRLEWHYRSPNDDEYVRAASELERML